MAWGVTCSWKKTKVFNQVKLTLFKYSLFIFKVQRVWVIILLLNQYNNQSQWFVESSSYQTPAVIWN